MGFWEVTEADWTVAAAYITARTAPPLGRELPPSFDRPVLPSTVAVEIAALRRAAGLGVEGMTPYAPALTHPQVSRLLRHVGAGLKRTTTNKRPLLLHQVRSFWESCSTRGSPDDVRDGMALVTGFFFACRARELLSTKAEDIHEVELIGGRRVVEMVFRRTKNRQSRFVTHEPFKVVCGNPLMLEAYNKFNDRFGFLPEKPVFRRGEHDSRPLGREWFASVVSRAAPGSTPHSCRVGLATELYAAGAELEHIMTVGRWLSKAAALYVIGSAQDQLAATDRLDGGGLVFTSAGLQRRLRSDASLAELPQASSSDWLRLSQRCRSSPDGVGSEEDCVD
jgi:integrase